MYYLHEPTILADFHLTLQQGMYKDGGVKSDKMTWELLVYQEILTLMSLLSNKYIKCYPAVSAGSQFWQLEFNVRP